jgi:hypothetical protein
MFSKLKQKTQEEKSLASATAKKARELQKGDGGISQTPLAASAEASNRSHDHQEPSPSDSGAPASRETGQTSLNVSQTGLSSNNPESESLSEVAVHSQDVASTESTAMVTDTALLVSAQERTSPTPSRHQPASVSMATDPEQQEASTPTVPTSLPNPPTDSSQSPSHTHTLTGPQTPSTPTHHKVRN